ncbi:MAG: translation initiation factor IF-2 N-terminal domain-containing protein, partial [Rothia dentocariosa]|nr:translation initiation factor IF-2 N-terminal domain-containing protein [Rothia dentocariosa]
MAKPRVHELAKEFGVTSKEVIAKLGEMNEFVKGPSSTLNPMVVKKLREAFPAAKPAAEAAQKPAASQKAASGASAAPKSAAKPTAPKPGPKSAAQKQSGTK